VKGHVDKNGCRWFPRYSIGSALPEKIKDRLYLALTIHCSNIPQYMRRANEAETQAYNTAGIKIARDRRDGNPMLVSSEGLRLAMKKMGFEDAWIDNLDASGF
jgi:hypothetical protein